MHEAECRKEITNPTPTCITSNVVHNEMLLL